MHLIKINIDTEQRGLTNGCSWVHFLAINDIFRTWIKITLVEDAQIVNVGKEQILMKFLINNWIDEVPVKTQQN